ncbi:hypothetical protein BBJ28_00011966 [Nothophytophthora sp. Chile5]|nr:hypothetical protein BBJ28_00011966 [Nothophytophthora sp. Chile5]
MASSASDPNDADTLRVLLSTDNHLGYAERDPVRGGDSFRTFREILQLAQSERTDLLLLGGDLFHENKPSRRTLYETMRLLRTHCMGDGAVHFQVVSDQSLNFPNFGVVNFEDPNYNVELPIFSIHGNHDDPSREGGSGGNPTHSLAALDLLSAANLVNYFGKSDKVDAVEVFPVLLTKGATRVAIYGLGNMRDDRLNRMFAQQKVVFRRPAERAEDWFSIFVVHQNRVDRGSGAKNCVPESVIPDFIDLVVWGHEHECLIDVQESVKGHFFVTQPGSSVATSLVEGEAKPKQVAVLEIHGQSFRMTNRELQTVRPFKMGEVILSEVEELDPDDPDVAERIREYLEGRVLELLQEAELEQNQIRQQRTIERERRQEESPFPLPLATGEEDAEKQQVLIRLRVEHTGFPVLVNQRFGGRFVGQVANPNDILLFYRRKKDRVYALDKKATRAEMEKALLSRAVRPTPLAAVTIEDILSKQLGVPEQKLVFLPEAQLGIALENYILKNVPSALEECVAGVLEDTQRDLNDKSHAKSTQEILSVVGKKKEQSDALHALEKEEKEEERAREKPEQEAPSTAKEFQSSRRAALDEDQTKPQSGRFGTPRGSQVKATKKATKKATAKKQARNSALSDLDEDSDFGESATAQRKRKAASSPPLAATRKRPARSAATASRSKQRQDSDEFLSDEEVIAATVDDDGYENYQMEDDAEEEDSHMTPRPVAKPRGRAAAAKKKLAPTRKRLRKSSDDDDDDDDEDDDELEPALSRRAPAAPTKRPLPRNSQADDEIDLCSSGSEPEQRPPRKRLTQTKKPPQPSIKDMFQKQEQRQQQEEDDGVESDAEFTQLTGGRGPDALQPPESQSESQPSQIRTRRKLPLSLVAASQSQSQAPKRTGGTASAARKAWGRSRR